MAFSDSNDPYALRGARMFASALSGTLSVFVGSVVGEIEWLIAIVAALWGAAGGLMVIGGPQAAQIGVVNVILLVVFAAHPADPARALTTALLFLAGGLLQIVLAIAAWPMRGGGREREIVGGILRQLAAYAREPQKFGERLPASAALTQANPILTGLTSNFSRGVERLRSVFNQAERIRLELAAISRIATENPAQETGQEDRIGNVMAAAAGLLDSLGGLLETGKPPADLAGLARRFDAAAERLRDEARIAPASGPIAIALAHTEALRGQMRAVAELGDLSKRARVPLGAVATNPLLLLDHLSSSLRANLSLRSAALRHALRLAACIVVAEAVAGILAAPHGYWIPMTAAIVLQPDYAGTFARGLARLTGTMLGLFVTTAAILFLPHTVTIYIGLTAVFMLLMRSIGRANYMLSVIPLTGLIVVLLAFGGEAPGPTIAARGIGTLIGGFLALAVYALWPTRESTQTPVALAQLIEAERRYFDRVVDGYLQPDARTIATLPEQRMATRLARFNAEASVERLYAQPSRPKAELTLAVRMLATLRRFALATMGLETGLYEGYSLPMPPQTFRAFATEVETGLHGIADALGRGTADFLQASRLRALRRALIAGDRSGAPAAAAATLIDSETDRITNALNTMTHLTKTRQMP